nr:MAG TPA: hypothetical protein [Caudoviricetes sp.]
MEDAIKSGYNLSELSPELQAIFPMIRRFRL